MSLGSRHTVSLYVAAAVFASMALHQSVQAQTIAPAAAAAGPVAPAGTHAAASGVNQPEAAASQPAEPAPATSETPGTTRANPNSEAQSAPASAPPSVEPEAKPAASATDVPATPGSGAAVGSPAPAASSDNETPVTPLAVDAAAALGRLSDQGAFDKRDRSGLIAAYRARDGRPIWMSRKGATPEAVKLAAEIAKADDWGLVASEFDVPALTPAAADAPDLAADELADIEVRLSLATLKYARHARGGRFEPTDLTPFLDRKSPVYEPESVLEQIATAAEPDDYLRKLHPQHSAFRQLRARYLEVRDAIIPGQKEPSEAERILANLEQWRWMPADLGASHIWVNIPQQSFNLVRNGRAIHTERIIIGKTNAQTPIFSDRMRFLVFHPFWGVPNTIKYNEILPGLQRGSPVLEKRGLRLQLNGQDVDPARFDWRRTDIRRFHVYQPPGKGNALGVVKFMFPNKHDVYLHDTPSKSLFKASSRAISAGCVRIQDPLRFAELLLAEDQGMPAVSVRALAQRGATENNQVILRRPVPVHLTYFTMHPDKNGKIESFKDVYGHEQRIRLALAGKMHLVQPVPQRPVPTEPVGRLVETETGSRPSPAGSRTRGYSSGPSFSKPSFSNTRPSWAGRVFSEGSSFSGGN